MTFATTSTDTRNANTCTIEITHIIVDRHLQYKNVLNQLKVDRIPVSNDILYLYYVFGILM